MSLHNITTMTVKLLINIVTFIIRISSKNLKHNDANKWLNQQKLSKQCTHGMAFIKGNECLPAPSTKSQMRKLIM